VRSRLSVQPEHSWKCSQIADGRRGLGQRLGHRRASGGQTAVAVVAVQKLEAEAPPVGDGRAASRGSRRLGAVVAAAGRFHADPRALTMVLRPGRVGRIVRRELIHSAEEKIK